MLVSVLHELSILNIIPAYKIPLSEWEMTYTIAI